MENKHKMVDIENIYLMPNHCICSKYYKLYTPMTTTQHTHTRAHFRPILWPNTKTVKSRSLNWIMNNEHAVLLLEGDFITFVPFQKALLTTCCYCSAFKVCKTGSHSLSLCLCLCMSVYYAGWLMCENWNLHEWW